MYGRIWQHLPGSTAVRAMISLLLLATDVLLLFTVVFFPWALTGLPGQDVSVDAP